jgi:hypothetical protein
MADHLDEPMDDDRPPALWLVGAGVSVLLMAAAGLALTVAILLIP